MVNIYLVDNDLGTIKITPIEESSMALPIARGMLHCADKANNQRPCKEVWLGEERASWLQYQGSNKYCMIK